MRLRKLDQAGCSIYLPQLVEEGFDDLDTLRDMREDDMIQLGIRAKDRETLLSIIEQLWKVGPQRGKTIFEAYN